MVRARRLAIVFACALPLSQVGRGLAAYLRGDAPATGAPEAAVLEVSAIALAAGLLAAFTVVGLGGGARSARRAWPFAWTFLALAALQLELHLVQSLAGGATNGEVALRGLLGQLPVAAVAALALAWLSARLAPAARRLRRAASALLALLEAAAAPDPDSGYETPPRSRSLAARAPRAPPRLLLISVQ